MQLLLAILPIVTISSKIEIDGKGELFSMGLESSNFNEKTIWCMVRWSKSGSIISETIRDALATIDQYQLMNQTSGRLLFLRLGGYGSRFKLLLLEHITNEEHKSMIKNLTGLNNSPETIIAIAASTSNTTIIDKSLVTWQAIQSNPIMIQNTRGMIHHL